MEKDQLFTQNKISDIFVPVRQDLPGVEIRLVVEVAERLLSDLS